MTDLKHRRRRHRIVLEVTFDRPMTEKAAVSSLEWGFRRENSGLRYYGGRPKDIPFNVMDVKRFSRVHQALTRKGAK